MKCKSLIIFLLAFSCSLAQSVDTIAIVNFDKKLLGLTKKDEADADLLVAKLTAGKSGDKEKFDAIFAWVAREIEYDWQDYFSSGSPSKQIQTILERKRAICVGYAMLMDTLCTKAGLQNVMITGFSKDDLFDVHDTLFHGNHAWNAVKLDGKWYVYDATWSTGEKVVELKRFSKWIDKKRKNFKFSYKKKKLFSKRKLKKLQQADICGKKPEIKLYWNKWRFWNRMKYMLLCKFKLKIKRRYTTGIKTDYYLCRPEVFAITHLPNDPAWTLCDVKTMKQFENDSAWYYLHDSVYKVQQREGRDCAECDAWLGMNKKQQYETLNKKSFALNHKDRFEIGHNEWRISDLFLENARLVSTDSIKLMEYDSALNRMKRSADSYQLESWYVSQDARKHKLKNRKKLDALLLENAGHLKAFNSKMNITRVDMRSSRTMVNKSSAGIFNWKKRRSKISNAGKNLRIVSPKNDISDRIASLKERFNKETEKADSLKKLLKQKQDQFELLLTNIALNVPQQALRVDSMEYWFRVRTWLRTFQIDNFRKPIVDTTKKLFSFERRYFNEVDGIIYKPFDTLFKVFNELLAVIKYRNFALDQSLNLQIQLTKIGAEDVSALSDYKRLLRAGALEDICWLSGNYPKVRMMNKGFNGLMDKQLMTRLWISRERWVERKYRHRPVDVEWQRRYFKYNGIAKFNKRLARRKMALIKKEKRPVEKREKIRKAKK